MLKMLQKGRWRARLAQSESDLRAAQRLRWVCFRADEAPDTSDGLDTDELDAICSHMLIEDAASGDLVSCFRFLDIPQSAPIEQSYSAHYYDLNVLSDYRDPIIEVGRFCVHPDYFDPDILRVAWGALAAHVDEVGAKLLIGCTSFHGTNPEDHAEALALLKQRYVGPERWRPRVKAAEIVRFADLPELTSSRRAMFAMPPLLRTYLLMGGWVSDHAVVDRDLGTLHVFTGLEVQRIPPQRVVALRAISS